MRAWMDWIGTAIIFISIGIILAGLADRTAPFKLISATVPAGKPGETITFDARVWRDIGHECSVTMYRYIFHSGGKRADLEPQVYSHETLKLMEFKTPGQMSPQIVIPADAAPGEDAYLASTLRYVCNKYHVLLPVDVHTTLPFTVLPP